MATSQPMQLGMVGLGRMGANIVRRIMRDGHDAVVYDRDPAAIAALVADGATGASSLEELVQAMGAPRNIWIMVPAGGITESVVTELSALLEPGDTMIDGGNSYYRDDIRRAAAVATRGIHYIDCGTSGGVWGLERGYSLMIGGDDEAVDRLDPIWDSVGPGVQSAPRTGDRSGELVPGEAGWLHCGPSGAGHFVKMVHNGIEYGIMAAFAEGLNILKHADTGLRQRSADAETAPLDHPEYYQYTFDLPAVTEVWRRGSVIGSWLLDLTALALSKSPDLSEFSGRVSDSGEGRWTSIAAIEEGVPAPVLTEALYSRFDSQGMADFAYRVMSAQRKEFGGHDEKSG
jgi:6-phosphogluconate dehydrogenase